MCLAATVGCPAGSLTELETAAAAGRAPSAATAADKLPWVSVSDCTAQGGYISTSLQGVGTFIDKP